MSDDHAARLAALEQLDEDLFDFPDVEGMADLIAASRPDAAGGAPARQSTAPASGRTRGAVAAVDEPKAPLPAPKANAPQAASRRKTPPRNADDLDEDLFGFGELHELRTARDNGPSELGSGDSLHEPSPSADRPRESRSPTAARKDPAAPAPSAAPQAAAEPAHDKAKRKKGEAEPRPVAREKAKADTAPSPTASSATRVGEPSAPPKRESAHASGVGSSPFLSFPTSIDLPPARSKLLWVLVGCFLLANCGIFLMTQQQSQSVNQTLVAVTSTLAEAVARSSNAAPREAPPYREPGASDVDPARAALPMLDPADFSNSNELGLHNARRLIEQGAYAEARRNLFFILANQDRSTPLTPSLREDIDYLIALTYYDQGRSIAVEEPR
jgi:hypothetical protein